MILRLVSSRWVKLRKSEVYHNIRKLVQHGSLVFILIMLIRCAVVFVPLVPIQGQILSMLYLRSVQLSSVPTPGTPCKIHPCPLLIINKLTFRLIAGFIVCLYDLISCILSMEASMNQPCDNQYLQTFLRQSVRNKVVKIFCSSVLPQKLWNVSFCILNFAQLCYQ